MQIDPAEWPELARLFDEALTLPEAARELWLSSLPTAVSQLETPLRSLLQSHAVAERRRFLATLPKLDLSVTLEAASSLDPGLSPGDVIGPYLIESEIGRGGMGAVYRARRADGIIKRTVALKLPRLGRFGADFNERFAKERDILDALAHPNIARLYDAGISDSGRPYLALEYVEGAPLTEYCDSQRLSLRARLKLFQQVLGAVQYAHNHLIIHRDLKPSNVIVNADGQAILLDFGIAQLIGTGSVRENEPSGTVLTPAYASPEQLSAQPISTASDIFSLGVLLYELLTGSRPTRPRDVSAGTVNEPGARQDPVRPSRTNHSAAVAAKRNTRVADLARALSGDLDAIALKALSYRPADRYGTAQAFSDDIERYCNDEPVLARQRGRAYNALKFVKRHTAAVAIGFGALVAVLIVAGIAVGEGRIATAQRDRALSLVERHQAVQEFLDLVITEAAQSDQPVTVSAMLSRSEALAESEFQNDPEDHAAVLDTLAIHYHTNGEDALAEPLLRRALDLTAHSRDADLQAQLNCDHALSLLAFGKVAEAKAMMMAVIDAPGTSDEQAAECLEYMSYAAQNANDADTAFRFGSLALERLRREAHPSLNTQADFIGSLGYAEHLRGHNAQAENYYDQALQMFARAGRPNSADAISVRNNWGIVSDGAGDPKRALELYDGTLAILSHDNASAEAPEYLIANKARALENIGRYAEAHEWYEHCLTKVEKSGTSSSLLYCTAGLASVAVAQDDLAAAQAFLDKAAAIPAQLVPEGSPAALALLVTKGRLALRQRRMDDARDALTRVIAGDRPIGTTVGALIYRCELDLQTARLPEAREDARHALEIAQHLQGGIPYSSRTGHAWLMTGRVFEAEGKAAQAHEAFQTAVNQLSQTVDATHPALAAARERLNGAGS